MNRTDIILTASGLSIEPETVKDAEDIYKYMGCDPEITRYTGWNPYRTLQATVDKIQRDISSDDGSYSWVIRKDEVFVGTIGAYDYQPDEAAIEIGYSIAREFWGKGYAGATAKAVVEFLLREPQIREIRAWSHRVFFASPVWRKLQNIFGECCISKLEKVAKPLSSLIIIKSTSLG